MNKTKILIWIIIILVVINLAAIVSGIVFTSERRSSLPVRTDIPYDRRADFFRGQLGLTTDQRESFINFNREFNQRARTLTERMNSLRLQMVDEMAVPRPDRKKLDSLCVSIGRLHTELKRATVDFYLKMKNVCNEDQQVQLNQLFERMTDTGTGDISRGARFRQNRGQGMMRGKQNNGNQRFN